MSPERIAIELKSLRMPLRGALATAARLGVKAVEFDARGELKPRDLTQTGVRQLRKLLDDVGLRIAAVGFATRRGYNVSDGLEARVAATQEALELARRLGCGLVVNHVGRVPPESEGPEWSLLVEVLTDLARYGQRLGVLLAAETGSEAGRDLARLLAALPAGSLAVTLNPGNLIVNGHSPLEAIAALGGAIQHVHAVDAVRDLAAGRGIEVPLGRGVADFPALLGALEQWDYKGYVAVQRRQAADPAAEIAAAVAYLRNL